MWSIEMHLLDYATVLVSHETMMVSLNVMSRCVKQCSLLGSSGLVLITKNSSEACFRDNTAGAAEFKFHPKYFRGTASGK